MEEPRLISSYLRSRGLYISVSLEEIQRGKSTCKKKKKWRKETPRGVGRKNSNLSQPDIGGHDLLPLMLQEREAAEKCPPATVPQVCGPPTPPRLLPPPAQALGTLEELLQTYYGYANFSSWAESLGPPLTTLMSWASDTMSCTVTSSEPLVAGRMSLL